MSEPPYVIDGANVLCYCSLKGATVPTGEHRIVVDGQEILPAYAAICKYDSSPTIYRFYCDENWNVLSDFDYSSVEEAIEAINAAYAGASNRFKTINS